MTRTKQATPPATDGPALPRFARWITNYGVQKLATALGVTRTTVHDWKLGSINLANGLPVAGEDREHGRYGTQPKPEKLGEIIALAKGQLTAADIYPSKRKEGPNGTSR